MVPNKYAKIRNASLIGLGTFFLAVAIGLASQTFIEGGAPLWGDFILLWAIVTIGVGFDIIGVAVTVADEAPLHAKAARRIKGAREAVWLARNADRVASFCNDVVGDVSGTLSGAVGAAIIFTLIRGRDINAVLWSTLMTAAIAGITVGGKAWGKSLAIRRGEEITYRVGILIAWLGSLLALLGLLKAPTRRGEN